MKDKINYIIIILLICIEATILFGLENKEKEFKIAVSPPLEIENFLNKKIVRGIEINSIYFTGPYLADDSRLERAIKITEDTEINAFVVDVKDFAGRVYFDTDFDELEDYGAEIKWIDMKQIIKRLHENNIYAIARIVVFEDPLLVRNRSELALKNIDNTIWTTYQGMAWSNPCERQVWEYNLNIAKEAVKIGFDEINFDYVRFPSDGNLNNIDYSACRGKSKKETIENFFSYIENNLSGAATSVDLFGLTTVAKDDIGIGQDIERAGEYFDYVCPMVYPSHFAHGFKGYENPAQHPYEIVYLSLGAAKNRENIQKKIRPWLQDFDLGSVYEEKEVKQEINATRDALQENYIGYMLWNAENSYTIEALK